MSNRFRNLVLEGGGVKGIAYIGALEELSSEGILQDIERVAGTSAGAITALLVGLKYSPDKIRQKMGDLDLTYFLDEELLSGQEVSNLEDLKNFDFRKNWPEALSAIMKLVSNFGICEGKNFRSWASKIVKDATGYKDPSFEQLQDEGFRDMYFIGANISKGVAEVYSHEDTPDMSVIDAVRTSMSFPFVFTPLKRKGTRVDGGLIRNYPIRLFDRKEYVENKDYEEELEEYRERNVNMGQHERNHWGEWVLNKETMGFKLDSKDEIAVLKREQEPKSHEIDNLWEYLVRLLNTILSVQQSYHRRSFDWNRTAYINTGDVHTLDFGIGDEARDKLIEAGEGGVEDFLDELNDNNSN